MPHFNKLAAFVLRFKITCLLFVATDFDAEKGCDECGTMFCLKR